MWKEFSTDMKICAVLIVAFAMGWVVLNTIPKSTEPALISSTENVVTPTRAIIPAMILVKTSSAPAIKSLPDEVARMNEDQRQRMISAGLDLYGPVSVVSGPTKP